MRIAVLHSEVVCSNAYPDDVAGRDNTDMMDDVLSALLAMGHDAFPVVADRWMFEPLLRGAHRGEIDLVFNLSDDGYEQNVHLEPHIAAFLGLIGLPCTGSDPLCLATCLDKHRTKILLRSSGIPTPNSILREPTDRPITADDVSDLTFPLMVKPCREDGSIGIRQTSVVETLEDLRARCGSVMERYRQPALVEEFMEGREFNIGILGRDELRVLPVSEIMFTTPEGLEPTGDGGIVWPPPFPASPSGVSSSSRPVGPSPSGPPSPSHPSPYHPDAPYPSPPSSSLSSPRASHPVRSPSSIAPGDDPPYRPIVSYEGKWIEGCPQYLATMARCPAEVDPRLERELVSIAVKAYRLLGVRDYGRIDIRLDCDGKPHVLEVNPNPDISRKAGLARMAEADGMRYEDLLGHIIRSARTST